ncbi:hypothetical protein DA099_05720 [Photobacterium damselae]|uniref:Uncharacterized protein n=1 Tax=Photobacterium damselae TaxID=38293 RepID=A0ACD3T057_PHODM|nr:DUF1190 domain-containing protein [Photobacterium damselae]MDC4168015.1 DUF1190 domain-containing protein [Photobacterium damselae]RDL34818.1 hypothetical protein BC461_03610 [Photobacterium damselae]TMX54102.1 hypothetical protein DA099_05720 [Photobacterium damselae]TMX69818.1 hypothetical protein DA090_03570 [Photobacterium damselae]TMX77190.1 hypothetical protein DA092_05380 [Photobacterium damselae]
MKRSKKVVYASMKKSWVPKSLTTITMASFALTGCTDNDQPATIYQTLDDCISDNPDIVEQCKSAYQYALEEAERTAPKYKTDSDCMAEFGIDTCIKAPNHDWFMPAMAGFMFARALNNTTTSHYYSQPMFRSHYPTSVFYDRWTTSDGRDYGKSTYSKTTVNIKKDNMKAKPAATRTISRGGFGSTVSAKSSWGSSRSSSGWGG